MSRLRSAQLMLVVFVALLASGPWATTALLGAVVVIAAARAVRSATGWAKRKRVEGRAPIRLGAGKDGRPVGLSDHELSAHGLILGASGSGKTTALVTILAQEIGHGRPVIAIDMKGSPSFAARLAGAAAAAGRPFRLWTPDGPSCWNPLRHGNATEAKDKLISTERFTEPHYQRAAERYIQTLLQVLAQTHPEAPPTLEEVVGLMNPKRLPRLLNGVPQNLADRVQDYLSSLTRDQVSAIRGLQTRLALITESAAGEYLRPNGDATIDLRAALDSREVILFSLNSNRYGKSAAQLATLVVQDLICATGLRLEEHGPDAQLMPAVVGIDEFSGIGGEHVVALFARGREAGVRVVVATQEMADLDRTGRGVRDQVLGNTAFKLVFRQEVPESAQTVAQLAGTELAWEETRQLGGTLFPGPPGRGTRREVERFVVHPNDVKSLPTGDAVLISKLSGERARVVRVRPSAVATSGRSPEEPAPPAQSERGRFWAHTAPFRPRSPRRAPERTPRVTRSPAPNDRTRDGPER